MGAPPGQGERVQSVDGRQGRRGWCRVRAVGLPRPARLLSLHSVRPRRMTRRPSGFLLSRGPSPTTCAVVFLFKKYLAGQKKKKKKKKKKVFGFIPLFKKKKKKKKS